MATVISSSVTYAGACRSIYRQGFFCLLLGIILFGQPSFLSAQVFSTQQIKIQAVFLFRFTQFVEWPDSAFPAPDSPFVIGVLGQDPFGSILEEAVIGESVKGHRVQVERYRTIKEIKNCHILFISSSENSRLRQAFAELKGRPILTVGDSEYFTTQGGAVRFLPAPRSVRLRINIDAVKAARLTASSKLLRVAEVVHTTK